jgi:hypothetical protein
MGSEDNIMKKVRKILSILLICNMFLVLISPLSVFAAGTDKGKNIVYLENLSCSTWDRYTGNLGDSFIDDLKTRNSARGIDNKIYTHGLEAWVARWNATKENSWVWKEWDLQGAYDTLSGEINIAYDCYNKTSYNTTIDIIGDDDVLYRRSLTCDTAYPVSVNVDISGVNDLMIYLYDNESSAGGTSFILGKMILSTAESNNSNSDDNINNNDDSNNNQPENTQSYPDEYFSIKTDNAPLNDHCIVTSNTESAKEGDTVAISVAVEDGYEISDIAIKTESGRRVDIAGEDSGVYSFIMPEENVVVTAKAQLKTAENEIKEIDETEDITDTEKIEEVDETEKIEKIDKIDEIEEPEYIEPVEEPEESADDIQNDDEAYCPSASFKDVDTSKWYHEAVDYVLQNNLMNGTGSLFKPDVSLNRAMMVQIIYNLEEPEGTFESDFDDVSDGAWYANAVGWASANGIVNGISKKIFAPDNLLTREQMASIFYRYAAYKGYDISASADLSGFKDVSEVDSYAMDAVSWANAEGLLNGENAKILNPQGHATRAQAAAILMRFCENIIS